MVNRDVLATFPCRVRRRGQVLAASPSHLPHRLRSFDRCRSLTDYRRANASHWSVPCVTDIS